MLFEKVTHDDLDGIGALQPEGWPDIVADFGFYVNSTFCYPIKTKINDRIVGTGTSIVFDNTAWIAHLIVDNNYRQRGIGYAIVEQLLKNLRHHSIQTILLTATKPGVPLYKKAGFRTVTGYAFFKRKKNCAEFHPSKNVLPFEEGHLAALMELDRKVSGENREPLLAGHLKNSLVCIHNNKLTGYYLPGLGEGPIVANTKQAGLELMKIKCLRNNKIVLPEDNQTGVGFLKQNGFVKTETKGTRMILGKEIYWKPENIYSRIGGNFG